MGHIERGDHDYVWEYGEPAEVHVPRDEVVCEIGSTDCDGYLELGDESTEVRLLRTEEEYDGLFPDADASAGAEPADHRTLDAIVLDGRGVTLNAERRPASSVVLGRVPAPVGWIGLGVGVVSLLAAPLIGDRRRYRHH
ncbi:hypothetical protein FH609_013495 [Streptomyces sp. 3MP-14]|uniref:Uncharacterized protein n=1 Tax=Streptomyces mimosae TaxID=2586635 RepID=A0A5N6A6C3_9ACTN|nr:MULTISPECIES: hypothetical protein [Streptomyces]KAB8164221.1 hypothetical protein FH607_016385 [Streptomyces mimosae]KAB8176498.1 hypothetical protein FH609_013495 [Streptomyces sp. 3MP-14]